MDKCPRYPNCDCFNDWEKPAKEIDPGNSELFVSIKQEIEHYLDKIDFVYYQPLIEIINERMELLSQKLHPLFVRKIFPFIEFHYAWKTPHKTDLLKLRKTLVARFAANNELNFYTDKKNIPNNKLVNETIEYFTIGEGARAFKPLEFLNLLWQQYSLICERIHEFERLFYNLESIPLTELERHILYGFIIKWFGGYPVQNQNKLFYTALKRIEGEFLKYDGETPEKTFCKADSHRQKHFQKLSIALNTAINNGLNANEIYEAMEKSEIKEREYDSFDDLFAEVAGNDSFGKLENQQSYLTARSRYNFEFNVWLQVNKGGEYGDESQYKTFLTSDIFNEFLKSCNAEEQAKTFLHSQTSKEAFLAFQINYQKLRDRFRVKRKATKEDCKTMRGIREGDVLEYDPEYKTTVEAFALLTNYYAVAYLELEKHLFIENYKVWNEATIKAEIIEIEKFISAASKESLLDASKAFGKYAIDKPEFFYLRLKNGFYEHLEIEKYPPISSIGNQEARIYGRYFLFYGLLKEEYLRFLDSKPIESIEDLRKHIGWLETSDDFELLRKYIRDNYLSIHPNNFTLERLKQIKRNISTWKLQLKDLNKARQLQEFIVETIADIDLKIARHSETEQTQIARPALSEAIKKQIIPDLPGKLISFNNSEAITKLHNELKGYFPKSEEQLLKALEGERLTELLLFPHNQNKFVEVFKRAKYNGFLLSSPTEIRNWICLNFTYRKKKGNEISVEKFNKNTVWDILTKDKGEPASKERICKCDWLPYKTYTQRQREIEKEKL